jgi:hypothetical protein
VVLGCLAGGAVLGALLAARSVGEARADAPGSCVLRGSTAPPKGTELWDGAAGGKALVRFTGAPLALKVTEWPADGGGRARVMTSVGEGVRLEGWVAASALAVFTTQDVAVVPSHVWITAGHKVRALGASGAGLSIERVVSGSAGQVVRASAACDALALASSGRRPFEVPGGARGYTMKEPSLELFAEPGGASVFTLRMAEGAGELFWSTEARSGFVRLASRGDLSIEAWARARDLTALKKGELLDQAAPPETAFAAVSLALDPLPRVARATHDVPIRAHRDEHERPIGVLEAGAEFYVMDTVPPYTSVLPKHLGFMPGDDVALWVSTSDIPK